MIVDSAGPVAFGLPAASPPRSTSTGAPMPSAKPSRPVSPVPGKAAPVPRKVFISHSSKNTPLALAVVADLEANGIPCWISSRDIRPGVSNWGEAIIDGMSVSRAVVLLLTEESNRSSHVMREAERAITKNIPILVVKFQHVGMSKSLEYYLSSAQFLDATAPPPQQHLRAIGECVREMLARSAAKPAPTDVIINVDARPRRRRGRWVGRLAGVLCLGAIVGIGWMFVRPTVQAIVARVRTTVDRIPSFSPASPPSTTAGVVAGSGPAPSESPPQAAPPAAKPGNGGLAAAVEAKAQSTGALAAFARSKLANFHREALLITKTGKLEPGKVSDTDAEILASCTIKPNMSGYESLARELVRLLDKSAQQKGTLTSDGLRTAEYYGRDARPHLQEISRSALQQSSSFLEIFSSDVHRRLISNQAAAGKSQLVTFPAAFLIYSEQFTRNERSGLDALVDSHFQTLLQQQGSGVVLLLDSAANSFRHTTWRWFHLSPSEWFAVTSNVPRTFRCMLTLMDASNKPVERDYYPLQHFGVVDLPWPRGVMVLSPFVVSDKVRFYVPEIALTKSVVVLRDDVPRVKDFTATIEEGPPAGEP